jgi:signal transduction histidine kinase
LESVAARLTIPVALDVPQRRWSAELENAAYMIISEALANVCKHAGTCTADVSVTQVDDELRLRVRDNGTGFGQPPQPGDLASLHDRVAALGGRLDVASSTGHGTSIRVSLPCA